MPKNCKIFRIEIGKPFGENMQNQKFNVLFVCSSNVCRSPYCEFMLRRMIDNDDELRGKVDVFSSAVFNRSKSIFPKAVDVLKREGFDESEILAHKPSFKTDKERFEKADVIIGMSHMHKLLTPRKYRKKYVTLSEAATGKYAPVPDPFLATSQKEYDKTMTVLKSYVESYFKQLKTKILSKE